MAVLYIQEYSRIAGDADGHHVQAGFEPAVTSQAVTFTTTTQSAAFNTATKFIRVFSDTACYVKFGSNPTATTATDMPLAANTAEFFAVVAGQKIAAVT